jgi:hypothetical protein
MSLDEHFANREAAEQAKFDLTPEELAAMQAESSAWIAENHPDLLEAGTIEDYTQYDEAKATARLSGLAHYLRERHPDFITNEEVAATDSFVTSTFTMWNYKDRGVVTNMHDGSFAFVVPPRTSRVTPEYGDELADLVHGLRFVEPKHRAAMLRGIPPWVVDRYQTDERGRSGLLICANVSGDLQVDLAKDSMGTMRRAAQDMINDAVDLAADGFGAFAVGYGATFPGLMNFGEKTRRKDVITTTGHAGTIAQIVEAIEHQYSNRDELTRLGVIGLGAIGGPAAEVLSQLYPGARVTLLDTIASKMKKLDLKYPGRFEQAGNVRELIEESDVIASFVTTAIELRKQGITNMEGKLVVDDSQPAQFNAQEVRDLGGAVLWPIATDENGIVVREFCGYGDLMANRLSDLFGCEAEVASLISEMYWLEDNGVTHNHAKALVARMAITGAVTAQQVLDTRERMQAHGIVASDPQSFGVKRAIPPRPPRRPGRRPRPHLPPHSPAPMAA